MIDGYRCARPILRKVYLLYHILNHANLFGGSYVHQAEQMMQKLLVMVN